MEITLFLNLIKTPSLLAFDKHSTEPTKNYQIIKKEAFVKFVSHPQWTDYLKWMGLKK